jgi:hypothetical protein
MAKQNYITAKFYTIDFLSNGFCYHTLRGVPKADVKRITNNAKLLGETTKITLESTKKIYF